jgi:hypothetical protein
MPFFAYRPCLPLRKSAAGGRASRSFHAPLGSPDERWRLGGQPEMKVKLGEIDPKWMKCLSMLQLDSRGQGGKLAPHRT